MSTYSVLVTESCRQLHSIRSEGVEARRSSVSDREIDAVGEGMNRRALVTKLAVGAFAVPAIVAFKLDSLARAGGFSQHPRPSDPGCHLPNGTQPNGTLPDGSSTPPDDDDHDHKKKKKKDDEHHSSPPDDDGGKKKKKDDEHHSSPPSDDGGKKKKKPKGH
jgi:hypothetical protein